MLAAALCVLNACASSPGVGPAVQERRWPTYLGTTGRAADSAPGPAGDLQPVWRSELGRGIAGSPALGEAVVAVAQSDRQVALLDRPTGELLWRRRIDLPAGSGPLLFDDRLFVAEVTSGARVYALRLRDGHTLWSDHAGDVAAPLALAGEALFTASTEGVVTRYHVANGQRAWRTRVGGGVRAAPLATSHGLLLATLADSLLLLDSATGVVRASAATAGTVLAAPALADDLVIVGTMAGRLEAFALPSLRRRWTMETGGAVVGAVAVAAGTAWAVTGNGRLWRVALAAGAPATRSWPLQRAFRAGPAPAGGGAYIASTAGEVAFVDSSGQQRWSLRFDSPIIEPPLADGRIVFVVTERGQAVMLR